MTTRRSGAEKQTISRSDVGNLRDVLGSGELPKVQLQDRLDAIRDSLGHSEETPIIPERKVLDDGTVIMAITLLDGGDRISGRGATTEEAVDDLERKLEAWPK